MSRVLAQGPHPINCRLRSVDNFVGTLQELRGGLVGTHADSDGCHTSFSKLIERVVRRQIADIVTQERCCPNIVLVC